MTNKEYSLLTFPDALDSRVAAKQIHEKQNQGWVKTNQCEYDADRKLFTYFFEREIKDD